MFWDRLEELFAKPISVAERPRLSEAFSEIARRYGITAPADTAFNRQFSIISWPIVNALMPFELAPSLGRLLARGPLIASTSSGLRSDIQALRTWAAVWEGPRLSDWLQYGHSASRVINALLGFQSEKSLNPNSAKRITDAFSKQSEAYFALKSAKRRRETARIAPQSLDHGALSLHRRATDFYLTVTWPPLSPGVFEAARTAASANNWRPRLWGQGTAIHPEKALGSLPIVVKLDHPQKGLGSAFPGVDAIFQDSAIVSALSSRTVDWDAPLVFVCAPNEESADRADIPILKQTGKIWLWGPPGTYAGLQSMGNFGGGTVVSADLSDPHHREILQAKGVIADASRWPVVIRHPVDAITLSKNQVRYSAPFLVTGHNADRIFRITRNSRVPGLDVKITAVEGKPAADIAPSLFFFERQSIFDALIESRLHIRVDSPVGNAAWTVEAILRCGEEIVSYASQQVRRDDGVLSPDEPILRSLQSEDVRKKLIERGDAVLKVRIVGYPWEFLDIKRVEGEVDWTLDDPSSIFGNGSEIRSALATTPHHFKPILLKTPQAAAPSVLSVKLPDGRFALPGQIQAPSQFDLSSLSSNFSDADGKRQLFATDAGVLELARSRITWASAGCATLRELSVRTKVTRQFERPLVTALCGRAWTALEDNGVDDVHPTKILLREVLNSGFVALPSTFSSSDVTYFEDRFSRIFLAEQPDMFASGAIDAETADFALSRALDETIITGQKNGRLLELDVNDFDLGAPQELWSKSLQGVAKKVAIVPLLDLISPESGAQTLGKRTYTMSSIAETSVFLSDWSQTWCLPRAQIGRDLALNCVNFWLNPATADPDQAVKVQAKDPFLARAVRYIAIRTTRGDTA